MCMQHQTEAWIRNPMRASERDRKLFKLLVKSMRRHPGRTYGQVLRRLSKRGFLPREIDRAIDVIGSWN